MENTTPEITVSSFFKRRFDIFKKRLKKNIDMNIIIFRLGLAPYLIIYFFCEGTKYGDVIFQIYKYPAEGVFSFFHFVFNFTTVINTMDGMSLLLPFIFSVVAMGLITYVLIEAIKLFFALLVDGIEFLFKGKDTEKSFYDSIN